MKEQTGDETERPVQRNKRKSTGPTDRRSNRVLCPSVGNVERRQPGKNDGKTSIVVPEIFVEPFPSTSPIYPNTSGTGSKKNDECLILLTYDKNLNWVMEKTGLSGIE